MIDSKNRRKGETEFSTEQLMSDERTKKILMDAIDQWLDKKFLAFSKNLALLLALSMFGALIALILWSQGWHK